MEIHGHTVIGATPGAIWSALHDIDRLQAALPACRSITGAAESGLRAEFGHRAAGVLVRITLDVTLIPVAPDRQCRIVATGRSLLTGPVALRAGLEMSPVASGTRLDYRAAPEVGGRLPGLLGVPVESLARKAADAFLARLKTGLETDIAAGARPQAD